MLRAALCLRFVLAVLAPLALAACAGQPRTLVLAEPAKPGDTAGTVRLFVASIRHYLGAYLLDLGGADAIVFTGGIGENSSLIRSAVCRDLDWFGISLDPDRNAGGPAERRVSADGSRVEVWTVPTNEELVVARQSEALLKSGARSTA